MKNQKEEELFQLQNNLESLGSEKIGIKVATLMAQRNAVAMILNLPAVVDVMMDQLEKQKAQAEAFKKAQESGDLSYAASENRAVRAGGR